ncbi:hypothetical protein COW86_01410, partial [Candidatus Kuenenbacteria bacterium CG22_combo_CG10-13_8_21_14_all_39_9]
IYGAPYKILEVLIAWPAIFMGLISPLLARAWAEKNIFDFGRIWQKAFDVLSIIIWPMIIGTLVLAKPLMIFIAGEDFARSGTVLQILIFAVGMIFLTHLTTYAIIAIGRQKNMIKFYVIAAILAVLGYVIFIPIYAYFAAAVITLAVEGFMLAATLYLLKKSIGIRINTIIFGKAMLAAVIMGYLLLFLLGINVILLVIIGALVYLGILWLTGGINKNILKELKNK